MACIGQRVSTPVPQDVGVHTPGRATRRARQLDTQKSRLGTVNFHQLPINAPKCSVMSFQRDGQMQLNVPRGRAV
jgi:hypothetical protein